MPNKQSDHEGCGTKRGDNPARLINTKQVDAYGT